MNREEVLKKISDAGVVGAGGAGFPTHKKLDSKVEYILANGAECEPMMFKDREVMLRESQNLIHGLELMKAVTGAEKIILGIKDKNKDLKEIISQADANGEIDYLIMKNVYPAGDEYVLVYEATGRRIPPGGIPLNVGAVVNNVESIANIAKAVFDDEPVTEKYLTITGAVNNPVTVKVPVGTPIRDCLALAGGTAVEDFAILTGGVMMGGVEFDPDRPVTKTLGGLIVRPKDHYLVKRKTLPKESYTAIGHSACDQCSMCTELCPRYLLGYPIQPHRVMRSLQMTGDEKDRISLWAQYCCECNVCSLFSCPEGLDPKNICVDSKANLREKNLQWDRETVADYFLDVHPAREGREIPIPQLMLRLGLTEYDRKAPFLETDFLPDKVVLPLRQHIGVPAVPVVQAGDKVRKGDMIARPPEGSMGVPVHASIDGKITGVDAEAITIEH